MAIGIASTDMLAVYAFISGGLGIMWPAIFALSVADLEIHYTGFYLSDHDDIGGCDTSYSRNSDLLQSGSDVIGYGIHQSY